MSDDIKKLSEELDSITDEEIYKVYTTDAMKMYLQSISIYPSLTIEEQKELFIKGEKDKLVKCMLKLVVRVAYQYRYRIRNLEVLDIIQEGNMGLLKALEKYEPSLGAFTTYAIPWIRQHIRRAIKSQENNIRKPTHGQDLIRKYFSLVEKSNSEGRTLTKEEIIKSLEIDDKKYHELIAAISQNVISINQEITEDGEELEEIVPDENAINESNIIGNIYNSELNIILKIALKPFYYYVIYYRYLIPLNKQKSLEVLAKEFNISRQAMESAEKRALEKVKPYLKNSCNHVLLKKFKEKIKMDIEYIKLEPLSIDAVIKYLYIKNDLTKEELKLYSLMNLSSVNYPDSFYEQKLNISLDRLKELKKVISSKLQAKMENQEAYLIFKNKLIAKNGTLIYKFVNDCEGVFLKDEIERINLNNNQEEDFNLEDIAKNRTFDLLVFLKTVLSPLCYYIFYSLYYDRQTKEQLAREIHLCYEGISADISGGIKKILKPYFSDYSKNYQEEINNLKNKYGLNYYYLKTTPLTPDDIIKYLYLKDELSFLERKIWELQLFGPFKYSPLDYSIILGLNLDECDELLKSLEEKIKNKFANVGEFKKYKEHTMDRRKGGIFRNLPSEIFLVNYDELFFKYQKLTFAEILALFTNINYLLNKEEIDLLIKFTNIAIKEELNLKERKKIISLLQILDLKLKALNLTYKK